MKVDAQPNWLSSLSKQALNSLSVNTRRVLEGSDTVIVNPAYESKSDDGIKGMIDEMLSKVTLTAELLKIEEANLSKFGPRSLAKPWVERKESLSDYFKHEDYDPGSFESGSGNLRPCEIEAVIQNLLKSSSAGLPYMKKKGLVLEQGKQYWAQQWGLYPCVLYTRTQEQGKTRNVWGFSLFDTMFEQRYFIPVLALERKWDHRAALIGPDQVDTAITQLLLTKREDEVVFCADFSAFDASVSPQHAYSAFSSLCTLFQNRFHPELYDVYRLFTSIGIWTPEGEWSGPHGVPSGSSFTNTIDSMVQFLVAGKPTRCQIQGDDGLYILNKSDLDEFKSRFDTAGLTLNLDKSAEYDTQEGVYLQRYYHPDYRTSDGRLGGVYSIYRAMNRIKYLERWWDLERNEMTGPDFFSLRTIIILENCKHHPCFSELVKLARSLDKYGLEYSRRGLTSFSRAMESKTRAGVFNQYGLARGIDAFETVKLLKTL